MEIKFHKDLAEGKWFKLSLLEQMANIGSEVSRAEKWQGKDQKTFWNAVCRALELFDLTLADTRLRGRLLEIGRAREVFCDAISGGKKYGSKLSELNRYFIQFAIALRLKIK